MDTTDEQELDYALENKALGLPVTSRQEQLLAEFAKKFPSLLVPPLPLRTPNQQALRHVVDELKKH